MEIEKALARDIDAFLKQYGKRDVNEPDEWSSPDACLLEAFARALEGTSKPKREPFSDWGFGRIWTLHLTRGQGYARCVDCSLSRLR
jgi:hypothetical protein